MTRSRQLELTIGAAKAGWLDFTVSFGSHRQEVVASGVLNDPLDELASAAVALLEPGPVDALVRFWGEPDWEELRFFSAATSGLTTVQVRFSGGTVPAQQVALERRRAGEDITYALAECSRRVPLSGRIEGWGAFPNAKLRRALNALTPDEPLKEFLPPWSATDDVERVLDEVRAEVGAHHPLHGVELHLRAAKLDTDDYLFETGNACFPLAVVHLSWQGSRSRSSRDPTTTLYSSWREWAEACMSSERWRGR